MSLSPLPAVLIDTLVGNALGEDLGASGDITSKAVIDAAQTASATIHTRADGVVCGLDFAHAAFQHNDAQLAFTRHKQDGDSIVAGDALLSVSGQARAILAGERVALNFLGHLSGIASATARLAQCVAHTTTQICDTRKTTPGLRAAEKYAVRAGGGVNHRFGLYDAVLIKDNHIAIAGGISAALRAAQQTAGHMVKTEIEVDNLAQLDEALAAGADIILLDNMPPDMLAKAVQRAKGKATTEASGGVTADNIIAIAESGVDYISIGYITHSAPALDVGLDINIT